MERLKPTIRVNVSEQYEIRELFLQTGPNNVSERTMSLSLF